MSYVKQTWEDLPSQNTPITAARLNHMEDGIAEAWEHGGSGVGETLRIGTILPYTGSSSNLPVGYMLCDGTALSRTTYSELFSVIGTSFGAGDGSTTFNLPNLKGRVLTGLDENDTAFDTLGETGGEKTHALSVNEMPSHGHSVTWQENCPPWVQAGGYGQITAGATASANRANTGGFSVNNSGGGQAHNNLQPYVVVNYIIKVTETTPVAAQIVGIYTESNSDGYSTNYINTLQTYSSVETRIGTWIDDKPIYRKVISNISTSSGNEFWVSINASVDTFVNISAFGKDANTGAFEPIPTVNTSDSTYNNGLRAYNSQGGSHANQIRITKGTGSIIATAFLIVEYTKTTD